MSSIYYRNPHALRVGDMLVFRKDYLRKKHGTVAMVTDIQRGSYSGDTVVSLETGNGKKLTWYLNVVRFHLRRSL